MSKCALLVQVLDTEGLYVSSHELSHLPQTQIQARSTKKDNMKIRVASACVSRRNVKESSRDGGDSRKTCTGDVVQMVANAFVQPDFVGVIPVGDPVVAVGANADPRRPSELGAHNGITAWLLNIARAHPLIMNSSHSGPRLLASGS